MTINASIIRRVAALQLAPEAMSEVLSILADVQDGSRIKSSAAIRQARYRSKKASLIVTKSITRDVTDNVTRYVTDHNESDAPRARDIDINLLDSKKDNILPKITNIRTVTNNCSKPVRTSDFERFYAAFPKRVSREGAQKAFDRRVKQGIAPEHMIAAAKRFSEACLFAETEKQFIPAPAVWLNGGRYDDEDLPLPRGSPNGKSNGTEATIKWFVDRHSNDEPGDNKSFFDSICEFSLDGERE